MQLPLDLINAIEAIVQKSSPAVLRKARESLSQTYRQQGTSRSIFKDEAQSLSYLAARFPATYGAVTQVLERISVPFICKHWLDLGSGPGTASLAALYAGLNIEKITLIEQSPEAIALGKQLAANSSIFKNAEWICRSLPCSLPSADVAIASYALGELSHPSLLILDWWKSETPLLILIEPGTPTGFNLIKKVRDQLISLGAFILAPCPHGLACPMKGNDWCHFSARVDRSRLHRYLKEGSLGYEDEKYSYLVVSRTDFSQNKQARVLRHPQKNSGHVRLTLCDIDGQWKEKVITKSNKEVYKKARHSEWGDVF